MQGGKRLSRDEVPFRWLYEWVQALVAVVLCAVVVFAFAAPAGAGVRPLHAGDAAGPGLPGGAERPCCAAVIEAGDIVIIQREGFRDGEPIVKRIIATEGQTVDIDFDAGVVYVDGAALEEDYIRQPTYLEEGTGFPLHRAGGMRLCHGGQPQRQRRQPGPGPGPGGHPVRSWARRCSCCTPA